jgi:glutathione peroxidase-family protein
MYDITMQSITGEEIGLGSFRDQVCLVVNVATL